MFAFACSRDYLVVCRFVLLQSSTDSNPFSHSPISHSLNQSGNQPYVFTANQARLPGSPIRLIDRPSNPSISQPIHLTPQSNYLPINQHVDQTEAQMIERINVAFSHWDADNDGMISMEDVRNVLQSINQSINQSTNQSNTLTDEMVESLIQSIKQTKSANQTIKQSINPSASASNDQSISRDEFKLAFMHKLKHDRFMPPADVQTEMEQDLARKRVHG